MKARTITILALVGMAALINGPVSAQDEALYVAPSGNVGLGLNAPSRQLHLRGSNAVFRMDRSTNSAAFMLVRTDGSWNVLKNFVVGVNASGADNGEFIINDLGSAVSGGGTRRMTIQNNGDVVFTGAIYASAVNPDSSIRFKENVEPIADPLALAQKLQGVRFDWKDSGKPSIGFIAEDVEAVLPEVVAHDSKTGEVRGLNYNAIVPVLLEALKEQQAQIEAYRADALEQQAELAALHQQVSSYQNLEARIADLESKAGGDSIQTVMVRN